jgi:hypothetical protein
MIQHLAQEALGGVEVVLCGEQEVDRVSVLVDGSMQIAPLSKTLKPPYPMSTILRP